MDSTDENKERLRPILIKGSERYILVISSSMKIKLSLLGDY
ncbi:hypothetical protein UF75_3988 [Desulfosporosinus sp. I2]|nr:hypothetical protein UF75_3988 [Desulfosporosinus sp. I2]